MPACIRSSSFFWKDKAFRKTSQSITLKLSCAQPLRTSVKNHWCQWPQRQRESLFHEGMAHTRYWAIRHSPLALCTHGASYPRSAQLHIPETTIMGIRDAFWLLLSSPEFTLHAELRVLKCSSPKSSYTEAAVWFKALIFWHWLLSLGLSTFHLLPPSSWEPASLSPVSSSRQYSPPFCVFLSCYRACVDIDNSKHASLE